jgi:hypothetical protein
MTNGREALALLASLNGESRLALRFASRASVDSVQFLDSVTRHRSVGSVGVWLFR